MGEVVDRASGGVGVMSEFARFAKGRGCTYIQFSSSDAVPDGDFGPKLAALKDHQFEIKRSVNIYDKTSHLVTVYYKDMGRELSHDNICSITRTHFALYGLLFHYLSYPIKIGERLQSFDDRRRWADGHDIRSLVRELRLSDEFIDVNSTGKFLDVHEAADFLVTQKPYMFSCRVRSPRIIHRDLMFSGTGEIKKLIESTSSFYVYGWSDGLGRVKEFVVLDMMKARREGVFLRALRSGRVGYNETLCISLQTFLDCGVVTRKCVEYV